VRSLAMPAPEWSLPTKVSQMLGANWYLSTSTLHPGIGASVAETHRIRSDAHGYSMPRWELLKVMKRAVTSFTAAGICAIVLAPISSADPTTHLKSEVDAARGASGCPALQLDPTLSDVSQRTASETDEYVRHTARFLPITGDTDVVRALRESGYNTVKAKLLLGYADDRTGGTGNNEAKAIKSTVLEGLAFEVFPDCAYKKYGVTVINDDSNQGWPSTAPRSYTVTAVVVAG
jgi:hypothetical protein